MRDEPTPAETQADFDLNENMILHAMLDDPAPGLWSVQELARAHGDPVQTADALAGLHAMGLVHRHEQFVWPTRAAARAAQIESRF